MEQKLLTEEPSCPDLIVRGQVLCNKLKQVYSVKTHMHTHASDMSTVETSTSLNFMQIKLVRHTIIAQQAYDGGAQRSSEHTGKLYQTLRLV